jgi:BlaI family transcriptional regulator, penicillinase repressor
MKRKPTFRLGNLQLRIMQVLWNAGEATVAEVQEQLEGERLAYTTVATMLRKMEDRELIGHREEGRRFIYMPAVSADDVTRHMADDLVERLFSGSLADAMSHLLEHRDVSRDELAKLQALIDTYKKRI